MRPVPALAELDAVQREARFVLPYFSRVVTLVTMAADLPDLEERHSDHIEVALRDGRDADAAAVIARVADAAADGCDYLLVPAGVYQWLGRHPQVMQSLAERYRRLEVDESVCRVFALQPLDPALPGVAEDGLPIPPPEMIELVAGGQGAAGWFDSGRRAVGWMRDMLARNAVDLAGARALLDFGCGPGRVVRHWPQHTGAALHGCDYNPYLVRWCREHLPFGRFEVNDLEPPLPFGDDAFDIVHSLSIFTHLDEPLQQPWFDEIARVVRPGGVFLLTFQGRSRLKQGMEWEFDAGQLVVWRGEQAGGASCSVWHPESYVRDMARGAEVLEYASAGAVDIRQDAVLFRKPG